MKLKEHQIDALKRMHNGCILNGGVGSGKSFTALSYYYLLNGGEIEEHDYITMDDSEIMDLYIITTAMKRDSHDWDVEMHQFLISQNPEEDIYSNHKVVVDSWNNITKYTNVENAFFIFDEQRVIGKGTWVKSFITIAKKNQWILLSATPGDCWTDYVPVFIANGYFANRSEFEREHVIYKRFSKFPQIDRYINTRKLVRLRDNLLVDMDFDRKTVPHHENVICEYDWKAYKTLIRERFDHDKGVPFQSAGDLCYALRKLVNGDISRLKKFEEVCAKKNRVIVFYNYDYELDILRNAHYKSGTEIAEWNGHKHQEVPEGNKWVYLVQYTAGCEGWNCIRTDTIIFYSQTYSYKQLAQACGRIDRLNTPYKDLYYYHFKSKAPIDIAISRALASKKKFNESKFINS